MKKLFSIIAFLMCVSFITVSCDKDDEMNDHDIMAARLTGHWVQVTGNEGDEIGYMDFNEDRSFYWKENDGGKITIVTGEWHTSNKDVYGYLLIYDNKKEHNLYYPVEWKNNNKSMVVRGCQYDKK